MARCLRRRARLGYYDIVGQIDVAVVCALLVGLCLCKPVVARPNAPAPEPRQNQTEPQDLEALRPAAEQGDAEAQVQLGHAYIQRAGRGRFVQNPEDLAEAARWYRLAAEQGHARAQSELGGMYTLGRGVPQDYEEAVRWLRLAADQGYAEAQHLLGLMYVAGSGVTQDEAEAVRWYRLAAEQGDTMAQATLGSMYAEGRGVPQDRVAAHMWHSLAHAQDSAANPDRPFDVYVEARDAVAAEMTPEQIAEAQRLAREWKPIDQR